MAWCHQATKKLFEEPLYIKFYDMATPGPNELISDVWASKYPSSYAISHFYCILHLYFMHDNILQQQL